MKVVNFCGQIANGKDVAADFLAERLNEILAAECGAIACCGIQDQEKYDQHCWHRCAFGDAVKETYMRAFDVDREFIEYWKRKSNPPNGYFKTVRESLMFIGDGYRQIKPSVWVDLMFKDNAGKNLVNSDGRYISEVEATKERGGINIAVWRPGHENDIEHPSESQLKPEIDKLAQEMPEGGPIEMDSVFDWFLVNDDDLLSLHNKIESQLIPYVEDYYS